MTNAHPYCDRLLGPNDPDTLVELGLTIAEGLGERHYNECYETPLCQDCIQDTPLEAEREEWAAQTTELEDMIDAVEHQLEKLDGDPSNSPRGWMNGSYWEGFVFGVVSPTDCDVCPDGR